MNEGKAVVVERLNRTLKNLMWREFTKLGHQKWVKILPTIVSIYNNKIHSSIKMSPTEGSKNPEKIMQLISENNYENENTLKKNKSPKFKMNERVRIYKYQYTFTKGYVAKWSDEIFLVSEIVKSSPITYRIKDLLGEDIEGRFYSQELQRSSF